MTEEQIRLIRSSSRTHSAKLLVTGSIYGSVPQTPKKVTWTQACNTIYSRPSDAIFQMQAHQRSNLSPNVEWNSKETLQNALSHQQKSMNTHDNLQCHSSTKTEITTIENVKIQRWATSRLCVVSGCYQAVARLQQPPPNEIIFHWRLSAGLWDRGKNIFVFRGSWWEGISIGGTVLVVLKHLNNMILRSQQTCCYPNGIVV